MAVGISLDNLAASVANEGGIGVIGTAGIGMTVEGYRKNFRQASIDGLQEYHKKGRERLKRVWEST